MAKLSAVSLNTYQALLGVEIIQSDIFRSGDFKTKSLISNVISNQEPVKRPVIEVKLIPIYSCKCNSSILVFHRKISDEFIEKYFREKYFHGKIPRKYFSNTSFATTSLPNRLCFL